MDWQAALLANWHVKLVAGLLIWAAYIDGKQLRVPNWLTYPMIFAGFILNGYLSGWNGVTFAFYGMVVGLVCLLPLYSVGGMGAGDVKLLAGVGAWLGAGVTFWAFAVSTVVGALMAVYMAVRRQKFDHHYANFWMILQEFLQVKNPRELSRIAAERKPSMLLLPYGIPICIGSIAYFIFAGMM